MSRKLLTILCVGALLAALCLLEQREVHSLTEHALTETAGILALIRSGDTAAAMEKARTLDVLWDERAGRMEMMIDHGSTDDVRYALSRLLAALEGGDRTAMLIYAGELEGSVEHVRERQQITLQNLL